LTLQNKILRKTQKVEHKFITNKTTWTDVRFYDIYTELNQNRTKAQMAKNKEHHAQYNHFQKSPFALLTFFCFHGLNL